MMTMKKDGDLLGGLNVYLIGMMGAGKTSVGQAIAQQLGYRFFDTDVLISRVAGQTINEIFTSMGETGFRQLETQVLGELSACTRSVIATGGGIVMQRENWSYLHQGLVVWLDAPVELIVERLAGDTTRPLLQTPDPKQKLLSLLAQRQPLYAQADLHIPIAAGQPPEAIAQRIISDIPSILQAKPVPFVTEE